MYSTRALGTQNTGFNELASLKRRLGDGRAAWVPIRDAPAVTCGLLSSVPAARPRQAGSCGAGSGHPSPSCHQSSRRPSCEIRGGRSLGLGGQGDAPRSGAGVRVSRRSRPRAIVTSLPELSHRRVLRVDSFPRLQDVGAQSAGSAGPLPARGGSPPSEVQAE